MVDPRWRESTESAATLQSKVNIWTCVSLSTVDMLNNALAILKDPQALTTNLEGWTEGVHVWLCLFECGSAWFCTLAHSLVLLTQTQWHTYIHRVTLAHAWTETHMCTSRARNSWNCLLILGTSKSWNLPDPLISTGPQIKGGYCVSVLHAYGYKLNDSTHRLTALHTHTHAYTHRHTHTHTVTQLTALLISNHWVIPQVAGTYHEIELWSAPTECLWHHSLNVMLFLPSCTSHSCGHLQWLLRQPLLWFFLI